MELQVSKCSNVQLLRVNESVIYMTETSLWQSSSFILNAGHRCEVEGQWVTVSHHLHHHLKHVVVQYSSPPYSLQSVYISL